MVFFQGGRRGDRDDLVAARVERRRHPLDVAALARRVPALVGEDHRDAAAVELVVQLGEALLAVLELFAVVVLRDGDA